MLSIRTLARSAPRTLTRALRPLISTPSIVAAQRSSHALFSTTPAPRSAVDSELSAELSAKLDSEIQIEEDIKANEQQPASIKDFLDNSPFELSDTPGQEVVTLTRTYGDEKITVSFSIADINTFDPYSEDAAFEDDDLADDSSPKKNETDDVDEMEDEDESPLAPINLSIIVEKPGVSPGALSVDATVQEGVVVVDNIMYFADAAAAKPESPEAAQKRADVYPGPPFGSLDDDLQVLMERFLEERGVNQALAVFVADFVDVKEQREYLRWLNNVKAFVDA